MQQAFATLLTVELIGLAAFPLVARAFPVLADRGWAISKPVGILLIATAVWLISYTRLIPNTPLMWWVFLGLLSLVSIWLLRSDWPQLRKSLARRWRIIVTIEVIFFVFFLMFLAMRAFDPAAAGTEKPMDLMMLTGVTSSEYAPPEDPWLAGEPIAYYYFGYWIYGGVNAMAGTAPSVAFNVGIALVAGLAASVTASFVVFLVRRDGAREKVSLIAGGVSAALLLLMSNLAGLWTLLDITRIAPGSLLNWYHGKEYDRIDNIVTWRPDDFWWWWQSSRITNSFNAEGGDLDFTIQEFPFFSILLGDFHPHLMSIPFVLTGITVLTALFIANRSISFSALRKNIPATVIAVLAIGSSGFINFWDVGLLLLLSTGLVVAAWIARGRFGVKPLITAVLPVAALWALGVLVYSPFYLGTAESQVQWPPLAPVKYGTRPIHFISIWLLLMTMAAPVALLLASKYSARIATRVARFRGKTAKSETNRNLIWRPAWITGAALVAIPWLIWVVTHILFNDNAFITNVITRLPVTGLLGVFSATMIAVVLTRAKRGADDGAHYVLILFALAVYLLFAAELFFVHDLFSNRMNTVFKFYYQAWIVLSVVGGYGAYVWWKYHPKLVGVAKWGSRTAIGVLTVVIISSLYFPVASAVSKTVASGLGPDLDGLSFMEARDEDELNVIRDISKISDHDDVLVEAVGGSYSEYSRISGSTGVPTPLGWEFHEKQWHGNTDLFSDRKSDVETLYTTDDKSEIYEIIAKYSLTMVVVGPRERSTYGNINMTMFDTIGDRIIEHGFYTVFSINKYR